MHKRTQASQTGQTNRIQFCIRSSLPTLSNLTLQSSALTHHCARVAYLRALELPSPKADCAPAYADCARAEELKDLVLTHAHFLHLHSRARRCPRLVNHMQPIISPAPAHRASTASYGTLGIRDICVIEPPPPSLALSALRGAAIRSPLSVRVAHQVHRLGRHPPAGSRPRRLVFRTTLRTHAAELTAPRRQCRRSGAQTRHRPPAGSRRRSRPRTACSPRC